jgi:hypothetical protein
MKKTLLKALIICLAITLQGCKNTTDNSAKLNDLINQQKPLLVYNDNGDLTTITINQAMAFHENHEHTQSDSESSHSSQSSHICMGVIVGYQAIQYAVAELFADDPPKPADINISVNGSMDGVWDVMSLYTSRELKFEGEETELNLKSYTFTATRISDNKSIKFCLRSGLVPDEFFAVKNQGANGSDAELRKIKQLALQNILSAGHQNCFEVVKNN